LTRMSRPPKVRTVVSTTFSTPAAVDTSAAIGRTEGPSSFAAVARRSSPRAQIVTRHPSSTSTRAHARPSPRLEPVTMATLSVRPGASLCRRHFPTGRGDAGARAVDSGPYLRPPTPTPISDPDLRPRTLTPHSDPEL